MVTLKVHQMRKKYFELKHLKKMLINRTYQVIFFKKKINWGSPISPTSATSKVKTMEIFQFNWIDCFRLFFFISASLKKRVAVRQLLLLSVLIAWKGTLSVESDRCQDVPGTEGLLPPSPPSSLGSLKTVDGQLNCAQWNRRVDANGNKDLLKPPILIDQTALPLLDSAVTMALGRREKGHRPPGSSGLVLAILLVTDSKFPPSTAATPMWNCFAPRSSYLARSEVLRRVHSGASNGQIIPFSGPSRRRWKERTTKSAE